MGVTGGTTDGWYLNSADYNMEYREVSIDGSADNTKQQERKSNTLAREQEHCGAVTGFSSDQGGTVLGPQAKLSTGNTATFAGSWIIETHTLENGERGSDKLTERQTLRAFTAWEDVE